ALSFPLARMEKDPKVRAYRLVGFTSVAISVVSILALIVVIPMLSSHVAENRRTTLRDLFECKSTVAEVDQGITVLQAQRHNRTARYAGYQRRSSLDTMPNFVPGDYGDLSKITEFLSAPRYDPSDYQPSSSSPSQGSNSDYGDLNKNTEFPSAPRYNAPSNDQPSHPSPSYPSPSYSATSTAYRSQNYQGHRFPRGRSVHRLLPSQGAPGRPGTPGHHGAPGGPGNPGRPPATPCEPLTPPPCEPCPAGRPGSPGAPGPAGNDGRPGGVGRPGPDGQPGENGGRGKPGSAGRPGQDGRPGAPGKSARAGGPSPVPPGSREAPADPDPKDPL
ncbi:hypothetical protein PMAYCL1PPCAC_08657, partial [Pristionchus mayeri]